jgi:riboflavin kinase/FMN adenylyltransferase
MRVLRGPYASWGAFDGPTAITIGVFDGVHRGHQATLNRLQDLAGDRPAVVVTFDPHPAVVLAPERAPRLLTTPDQRLRVFAELGLDAVAFLDFDEAMRDMEAEAFVTEILTGALRAEVVVVGSDFRFGRARSGDGALLASMGGELGFAFEAVDLLGGDAPVSSTAVRSLLSEGRLDDATALLGRRYAIEGVVVAGSGRGRSLGVSTANLGLDPTQFVPGRGVYAAMVRFRSTEAPGVCNVGVRPTFGNGHETVEVHVLGFKGDLSGETIEIEFRYRLRDERAFAGPDELLAQIRMDIDKAAVLLTGGD